MARGPTFRKLVFPFSRAEILQEHKWLPVVPVPKVRCRQCGSLYHDRCDRPKRYDADLLPDAGWME